MCKSVAKKFFKLFGKETIPKNKYILVVDDSDVERRFYCKALERAGYDVGFACNGISAIKEMEVRHPDLVISDLVMPGMNGKEFCQTIKNTERLEKIPFMFLTGSAAPGEVVECFEAGGEFYLEKPIDARTLVRQVGNIFNDLEQETQLSRDIWESEL